jgi:hypothetical protein
LDRADAMRILRIPKSMQRQKSSINQRFPSSRGKLKLNWLLRLLLHHRGSAGHMAAMRDILDSQLYEIASA